MNVYKNSGRVIATLHDPLWPLMLQKNDNFETIRQENDLTLIDDSHTSTYK